MRIRTATARATGAVVLVLAASVVSSAPALAADPAPATGTVVLSDEAYDRFAHADPGEQELIMTNRSYLEAWLFCLRSAEPSHVEPNAWGHGYVCIPDGAVQ
ncbi:hypothetical protein OKJ48_33885 [Streptomyces kunmingensis]|uniref:Uncharacterized protein n=1 Tax=Streptomyces kunmingensis TaxID=68225 RepID=A0ABU6CL59_9ACTN|nr:hypothetical protein [Streptomyces kunmingensis]MEB3965179.1 hypothetical protein [Streptomyces kunmingensis]